MPKATDLLRVPEAAERFRVHETTVYRWIAKGHLRAHRLGIGRKGIRISHAEMQRFLHDSLTDSEAATPQPESVAV